MIFDNEDQATVQEIINRLLEVPELPDEVRIELQQVKAGGLNYAAQARIEWCLKKYEDKMKPIYEVIFKEILEKEMQKMKDKSSESPN